ncbi:hypothetical protein scyTo_0007738 [Scyliorhinus torazame]|uniref:G-protein coupled receptors family 2 profile 1 domain-containing protein n=2 Tax=Scyliorhinus torazame TaxID=75743 RepID=A0A401NXC0_SCYTO|nr:hypothetical protein [Scyliorhinus torazame]
MRGRSGLSALGVICCYIGLNPQINADGITKEEQIYLLIAEKASCDQHILNKSEEDGSCSPEWDGLTCWPSGLAGELTAVPCPSYIYDFNHNGFAYRQCEDDAKWKFVENLNRTWTNYTECITFLQTDNSNRQDLFERLYVMYTVGYSVSLCSLTIAIMIIGYFK